jgi:hypothetical protein
MCVSFELWPQLFKSRKRQGDRGMFCNSFGGIVVYYYTSDFLESLNFVQAVVYTVLSMYFWAPVNFLQSIFITLICV